MNPDKDLRDMKANPTRVKITGSIFVNKNLGVFMHNRQTAYSNEIKIGL